MIGKKMNIMENNELQTAWDFVENTGRSSLFSMIFIFLPIINIW